MNLKGLSGKLYQLETKPFSSGGEGDIYGVVNIQDEVVKIYHPDRRTNELEQKLRYMTAKPPAASVLSQVAWPLDVAYDSSGAFCGFAMPKLSINAELSEIYVYPPKTSISYENKLVIAQNICVVITEVHNAGYIFGDFNPRNIGINQETGKVAFLDTDSYHIIIDKAQNKAFRCNVCAPGYAAPELLEKCAAHIAAHPEDSKEAYAKTPLDTFTKETDNFALAIHLFKLLMNGFSPFGGIKETESASTASPGVGDTAVRRDSYCFKPGNKPQSAAVPPIDILPQEIADLFTRAFILGKVDPKQRPSAVEWHSALSKYQSSLVTCTKNKMHMYLISLQSCPWCEADARYAASIAPKITQKTFTTPVSHVSPPSSVNPLGRPNPSTTYPGSITSGTTTTTSTLKRTSAFDKWSTGKKVVVGIAIAVAVYIFFQAFLPFALSLLLNGFVSSVSNEPTENKIEQTTIKVNQISVPPIGQNIFSIDPIKQSPISIGAAQTVSYDGNLIYNGQTDTYSVVATQSGYFRAEVSNIKGGGYVSLDIYDPSLNSVIVYDRTCYNGEGVIAFGLEPGKTYEVRLQQKSGLSSYTITFWFGKPAFDISSYTQINDSIDFVKQENLYLFTPTVTGRYSFGVSELRNNSYVEVIMYNHLDERIERKNCFNGDWITYKWLEAGKTYKIYIVEKSGVSPYTFKVGNQKPTVDISDFTKVNDSVEFNKQLNIYTFTVPYDGRYRFEFSGMLSGTMVDIYVENYLGETVEYRYGCKNGQGVTAKGLTAGDTYTVYVIQNSGFSSYSLMIGHQKPIVEVKNNSTIADSIEYIDQRNVYSFTNTKSGDVVISISDMLSDVQVQICVFNDLFEVIADDSYIRNGNYVVIRNATPGSHYEIQVRQNRGFSSYKLNID